MVTYQGPQPRMVTAGGPIRPGGATGRPDTAPRNRRPSAAR